MTEKTIKAIKTSVATMFQMNALADSMYSDLRVKFQMVRFSERFHQTIAHKFPEVADNLLYILTESGIGCKRDGVEAVPDEWSNPAELFSAYHTAVDNAEGALFDAYYAAQDSGDADAASVMTDIIKDFRKVKATAITLEVKAKQYGDDVQGMDNDTDTLFA